MGVKLVLTVEIEVFDEDQVDLDLPGVVYHLDAALASRWYTLLVKEGDDPLYYADRSLNGDHLAYPFPAPSEE